MSEKLRVCSNTISKSFSKLKQNCKEDTYERGIKEYYAELSIDKYEGDIVISCVISTYKRRAFFTGT